MSETEQTPQPEQHPAIGTWVEWTGEPYDTDLSPDTAIGKVLSHDTETGEFTIGFVGGTDVKVTELPPAIDPARISQVEELAHILEPLFLQDKTLNDLCRDNDDDYGAIKTGLLSLAVDQIRLLAQINRQQQEIAKALFQVVNSLPKTAKTPEERAAELGISILPPPS